MSDNTASDAANDEITWKTINWARDHMNRGQIQNLINGLETVRDEKLQEPIHCAKCGLLIYNEKGECQMDAVSVINDNWYCGSCDDKMNPDLSKYIAKKCCCCHCNCCRC